MVLLAAVGRVAGMLDESVRATGIFEWLLGRYLLDKDGRYMYAQRRQAGQQQQQQQQSLRETTNPGNHTIATDDDARGAKRDAAAMMGARCAPLIGASGDDTAILGMPFYRANMVVHDRLSRKVKFAAHDGNCAALRCKASVQAAQSSSSAAAAATAAAKDDERLSHSSTNSGSGGGGGSSHVHAARSTARLRQQRRGRSGHGGGGGGGGGGAIQPGFPLFPSGPSVSAFRRAGAEATRATRATSSRRSIDAHQRGRLRVTAAELPYIDLSRLRLPSYYNGSGSGASWPVRRHVGASMGYVSRVGG